MTNKIFSYIKSLPKNSQSDFAFTLQKISHFLQQTNVECVIFDNDSSDF